MVALYDGTFFRMGDIVSGKLPVMLKGMDEQGNIIPVKVIDWHSRSVKDQQWLKIKVEAVDQPIYCTPDHRVWVNGNWQRADTVKTGDEIRTSNPGHDALIHGILLGDGHVDKRGRLRLSHSAKQFEWFDAKRSALNGPTYHQGAKQKVIRNRQTLAAPSFYTEVWISPTRWRTRFYGDGGRKFIPPESWASLAVWYCDDGTLVNGKIPRIIAHRYYNVKEMLEWFEIQFRSVSLYKDFRTPNGGAIAIRQEGAIKFFELIAPFVPPCMEYKLPQEFRGRYNNWLETWAREAQRSIVYRS